MSIFLTRPVINTEEERNAKADILELINFERFCRDNAQWDEMRKCFAKDSFVNISWYIRLATVPYFRALDRQWQTMNLTLKALYQNISITPLGGLSRPFECGRLSERFRCLCDRAELVI